MGSQQNYANSWGMGTNPEWFGFESRRIEVRIYGYTARRTAGLGHIRRRLQDCANKILHIRLARDTWDNHYPSSNRYRGFLHLVESIVKPFKHS
ncbi:hypothetical protein AVEN_98240-1 [Araneus ventricosus]|uniref:Uncharacterized protein n=1 Tax=Araneus ventricosus TaxID=182803 RepID=A0A4Y2GW32_ARAVE|nr:hypothetical protein AVEN_98240-1 [Araneus ventricosus]